MSEAPPYALTEGPQRVPRDNLPDLIFTGKLVGIEMSKPSEVPREQGRTTTLAVWETKSGTLIAQRVFDTEHASEVSTNEAMVCAEASTAMTFLGYSALAKALYARLGWDATESVD